MSWKYAKRWKGNSIQAFQVCTGTLGQGSRFMKCLLSFPPMIECFTQRKIYTLDSGSIYLFRQFFIQTNNCWRIIIIYLHIICIHFGNMRIYRRFSWFLRLLYSWGLWWRLMWFLFIQLNEYHVEKLFCNHLLQFVTSQSTKTVETFR